MLKKNNNKLVLLFILLVAAFLRFYRFDLADVINDEVFYGFRAIGLIDFLNTPHQTTPYEWYEQVPTWAKFSFHDHPPLGFYIQHAFFKIFGQNILALRLPFIFAGVLSVYLTYLIARRLFSSQAPALLSAGILAVNNYHVWVSRIGMQESLVIFLMLLAIWLFLKATLPWPLPSREGNQSRSSPFMGEARWGWFYAAVAATSLAILMKYTAVILLPIFGLWLLWKRRDLRTLRRIIIGSSILLAIVSPIIIYNLGLYWARGHFDFQLSFLLKQNVPEWQMRPGRDVGGLIEKFQNFGFRFWQGYGIIFSIAAIFGFVNILWQAFRKNSSLQFLLSVISFLFLLFLAIGPQERFLAMLAPFLAMGVAGLFFTPSLTLPIKTTQKSRTFLGDPVKGREKESSWPINPTPKIRDFRGTPVNWQATVGGRLGGVLIALFLVLELALTTNTYLLTNPKGQVGKHYSILRYDHNNWGYGNLEKYLQKYYEGNYPAQVFGLKFPFARKLQQQALQAAKQQEKKPVSILFVTDTSMHGLAGIWYFARYALYGGWPMINSQSYAEIISKDPNFFRDQGFATTVFVKTADTLKRTDDQGIEAGTLEQNLKQNGIQPAVINRGNGATAFRVYEY